MQISRRLSSAISTVVRSHIPPLFNPLTAADVYKTGHPMQYIPGCSKVKNYTIARRAETGNASTSPIVFFGLQPILDMLAVPITHRHVDELMSTMEHIVGPGGTQKEFERKMRSLADLGYWPLEIKAVPEGTVLPAQNVLITTESTHSDFYWAPGYVESLMLKVWYPITVATTSYKYRKLITEFFAKTVDESRQNNVRFMVHDFGLRGDTSESSAAISGAAHLLNFVGSDTIPAFKFAMDVYGANPVGLMSSVPASEHATMTSFGRDNEIDAFRHMLNTYKTGPVSIVSDTYNIWNVVTNIAGNLKEEILNRDGVTVFRPDSGNPEKILMGNEDAEPWEPDGKGVFRLLEEQFGSYVNEKGYRVLNDKVRVIYGDGMYYERYYNILKHMERKKLSAENLVIGIGGILRSGNRDTHGIATKATLVVVNGKEVPIMKDPITDPGKRSHTGHIRLNKTPSDLVKFIGSHYTTDREPEERAGGELQTVFKNGRIVGDRVTFDKVRKRVEESL